MIKYIAKTVSPKFANLLHLTTKSKLKYVKKYNFFAGDCMRFYVIEHLVATTIG